MKKAPPATSQTPKPIARSRRLLWVTGAIGVVIVICGGLLAHYLLIRNYAEDAAAPIDQMLVEKGAIKTCASGDAGRGPDNHRPHYSARYQLSVGKDAAEHLITDVARANGLELTPQPSNYAYIYNFADDNWRSSSYPGYSHGDVLVRLTLLVDGDDLTCGSTGIPFTIDDAHTALILSVVLPDSAANK